MTSFSNLTKYKVATDRVVPYDLGVVLGERDGKPVTAVLRVAPANELNTPLLNEVLRRGKAKEGGGRKVSATPSTAQLLSLANESREEDRELYAKFVVKGWANVFDDTGKESPFTEGNCHDFLRCLPDDIFDDLRRFCQSPDSFRISSAEALAKN